MQILSVDSAESVQDVIPQKVDNSKRDAANNRHNDYKNQISCFIGRLIYKFVQFCAIYVSYKYYPNY